MNEKGFSLVSFIVLLPVVLSVLLGLFLATGLTYRKRQNQHRCEQQMLSLQSKQSDALNKLLGMNPKARRLQKMRTWADRAHKIALSSNNPPTIAAATAWRFYVIGEQVIHQARQRAVITKSKWDLNSDLQKMKSSYLSNNGSMQVLSQPFSLNVISKGESTGSPTWHTTPTTEKQQTVSVQWKWSMPASWDETFKFLEIQNNHMTGDCAGTIRKRSRKWRAELAPTSSKIPQEVSWWKR